MPSPTVFISNLSVLKWETTPVETFFNNDTIKIWRVALADLIPFLKTLQPLLSAEEIEKAQCYKQETDRQRYLIGKTILRILLSRYLKIDPKQVSFQTQKNKKPELENAFGQQLHFNVSHSGTWILIAIADSPVGIDVEKMHASFTYQNLLSFSFNPQEIDFIEQSEKPYQSFYQLWTRKESLLKATGKGLVDELSRVPSLNGVHPNPETLTGSNENWQVLSFAVNENHVGSVAFMPIKTALHFFNFRL